MLKELQKLEALNRMKKLRLHQNAINEFLEEDKLNKSELAGKLFWLTEEEKKLVFDFEERTKSLVYHVILTQSSIGIMYSFLYVSKYADEWSLDQNDLKDNLPIAYVYNASDPDMSELGTIQISKSFGGLVRKG